MRKTKLVGTVRSIVRDDITGDILHSDVFKNTVLRVGRRQIVASLGGNLLGGSHTAFINRMAFGTGGVDVLGNKIPVPETLTTFIGGAANIKDIVPAYCKMSAGDLPKMSVVATIPKSANANGNYVTQLGLVLSDDTFYAIATTKGFYKTSTMSNTITWEVDLF